MCPRERDSSKLQEAGSMAAAEAPAEAPADVQRSGSEPPTEADSPPNQRGNVAPCDEKWVQVRNKLIDLAESGNSDVARYGDMITSELACTRFLRGAKGNVDKAVEMFETHLTWRSRYKVETIVDEDFSDLKAHNELYWGGQDREGVMTLMWNLRKHDAKRTDAKRFVRFFIHQIETGLRTCRSYPNGLFNIAVDLDQVGYGNTDQEMGIILQSVLSKNYPKVRKGLFVFPVNWFVQLFWDTLLRPLLSTLQPDIEDKICPLTGDWKAKLRERYELNQIETRFGGELDLSTRPALPVLPYAPVSYAQMPGATGAQCAAAVDEVSGAQMKREQKLELETKGLVTKSAEMQSKGASAAGCKPLPSSPLRPASNGTRTVSNISCETEEEFLTPDASPREDERMSPAWTRSPGSRAADSGSEEIYLEADEAREEVPSERRRGAIVVGRSCAMAASDADELSMPRSASESELAEQAAHTQQVLHAAHGGIFDAHTHAERAAVMTAAIHSMTEAGLDEEMAKKVFELDKAAVARVLAAVSRGAEGLSPRGTCLEEILSLCEEFGIKTRRLSSASDRENSGLSELGLSTYRSTENGSACTTQMDRNTSLTEVLQPPPRPPTEPAAEVDMDSWINATGLAPALGSTSSMHPVTPRTPPENGGDGGMYDLPAAGVLITDDYLRATMDASNNHRMHHWVAENAAKAQAEEVKPGATAGRPQALQGGAKGLSSSSLSASKGPKPKSKPKPKQKRGGSSDSEDEEEGALDLIFNQLEILRLLQIVMR